MNPTARTDRLSLGVLATSRKENERRLPIHPRHLDRIDSELRARIHLEHGYGSSFGVSDDSLATQVAGLRTREEILAGSDIVLLPKPTAVDASDLREGQVLWGWPHCVQDADMTQVAVDSRLTLIAWEAMNHWTEDGGFGVHVFQKNNELAGYCSVLHALSLIGSTGHYGRTLRAAVISFGATARGAVTALTALGICDITVLTQREVAAIAAPTPSVDFRQIERASESSGGCVVVTEDGPVPAAEYLSEYDVVVNCILQDTDAPLMFVTTPDLAMFASGSLLIDISCDEGMGFEWARPTTFRDPVRDVGDGVHYYAVDHSPSYLWNAATWENSEALLPYLPVVMGGPVAWDGDATISRAIEIRNGVIQNTRILSFQGRAEEYPHPRSG